MLRAALTAVGWWGFLAGLFLIIDYFHRKALHRLSLLTSLARSYFKGDPRPLDPDEIKGLRRWLMRGHALWSGFVLAVGFIVAFYGESGRAAISRRIWLAAPLLVLAIVNDFSLRCPRCGTFMVRNKMVLMSRQCVRCGVGFS
jgi:hypothetical protein